MTDGAETPILKGLRELASHLRPKFRTQGARFLHLSRNDFDRLRDEVAPLPEHAYAKRHWPQFVFVDEIRVGLSPLLGDGRWSAMDGQGVITIGTWELPVADAVV
jgi:hypothetical protein